MAMVDLKAADANAFMHITGNKNENVLQNIQYLAQIGKLYEIRTVVSPSIMNVERIVQVGASLIRDFPDVRYKLIQYRENGVRNKYRPLLRAPSSEEMSVYAQIARDCGVTNVVIV